MNTEYQVKLSGVPETMLWTLHNRASEAKRPDGLIRDPDCLRVYESLAYDYRRSFGEPDGSHGMRSRIFDDAVKPWLAAHRGGTVVELGAGLETQFQRCDDGYVRWLCVDVPEAIDARERFFQPTQRCRHIRKSALDATWINEVDPSKGVFVTAQGLFMYFEEADVRWLVTTILERLPGVDLMFDTIPRWFSSKTMKGFAKTKSYTAPCMPWGIDRDEIEPVLRAWSDRAQDIHIVSYGFARGFRRLMLEAFARLPGLRNVPPTVVRVRAKSDASIR